MPLPLRITINNTDYHFKLIVINSADKANVQLEVEINGIALIIVRRDKSWVTADDISDPNMMAIAEAIGKSIALRYRI